jgi:hypothetical protein
MKTIILSALLFTSMNLYSQSEKKIIDKRNQLEKEDSNDLYNQSQVTTLDILEALDLASIRIHKFKIGTFDKEHRILIFADEYIDGKVIKTDTLLDSTNDYGFWIGDKYNQGFIDQIKIFTKTESNNSELRIKTYALSTQKEINLGKTDNRQFYNWREYEKTDWKLDEKVPLLIFASSWLDKQYNFHRFCGVVNLKEGDKRTTELLTSSPNYVVINYMVTKTEAN